MALREIRVDSVAKISLVPAMHTPCLAARACVLFIHLNKQCTLYYRTHALHSLLLLLPLPLLLLPLDTT
jgi:hypothetical protein